MLEKGLSRRAILGASLAAALPSAAAGPVDLALVLAIDCSYSVDAYEYQLQMRGTGQALLDPHIIEAIMRGARRRIAIASFLWSDPAAQFVLVPWQLIGSARDAQNVADFFLRAPRDVPRGATATGNAMLFAQDMLGQAPSAFRRVLDISTDGRGNMGVPVRETRDKLVAAGITINGLAIVNEVQNLDQYMEAEVVGGDGHFVIVANDYNAYTQAIKAKLYREITSTNLS